MNAPLLIPLVLSLVAALPATGQPNIVYILADDMGYADAGFNGGREIRTPHLDRIARGGAVLKSFYVQPVCSPTRSTLMTGRYPNRTGVYSVVRPRTHWGLPLAERTLPQALREAGYETAICGKWHLGEFKPDYRPTKRGFDHQYGHWFGAIDYFTHMRDGVLDWHRDDEPCDDKGYSTTLIATEACRMIRERDSAKPLFLYLPFNAVHGPHQVPDHYCEPYTELKGVRRTYAGMLAAMDEAVGKVLDTLDAMKLTDNTLIVFSSDNGGPSPGKVTSNGPLRAGKGTIYEGGVRVCAFASWPGKIEPGRMIDEPLHGADWYPTLLKIAGASLDQPLPIDGRDILPVLTKGAKSPHEALILNGTRRGEAAIRMGEWKLVVHGPGQAAELYHLGDDIGEKNDLAAKHPDKVRELRAKYDGMMRTAVPAGAPDAAGKPAGRKKGPARAKRGKP